MYKAICVLAFLVASFALTSGSKIADASAGGLPSPVIVARAKLANQTAPIPTTTIFTPTQDGLYRISAYATVAKADPNSQSAWSFGVQWTDDAGAGQLANGVLFGIGNVSQAFIWENSFSLGGATVILEAKAGTPITYSMTQCCSPDNSAYSLYYTLERLE